MQTTDQLANDIYQGNVDRGFHEQGDIVRALCLGSDDPFFKGSLSDYYVKRVALVMGELNEAVEELRAGRAVDDVYTSRDGVPEEDPTDGGKPEGFLIELIDARIRLDDLLVEILRGHEVDETIQGLLDWKLDYNAGRGFRHGGKAF